jgi:hypothetical protein
MTLACLAAAAQQTTTKTLTFDPRFFFPDPSYCVGGGCNGPTCPVPLTQTLGQFNDPLPPVSKLRSASFTWKTGNDKSFSFQVIPHVTLFLDGTALGPGQDITNLAVCNPSGALLHTWTSQDYPSGFPNYVYRTPDSPGANTMTLTIDNPSSGLMLGEQMSVSLTYEVPPPFDFNVTDSSPEADRHILLSNLDAGYDYPAFQAVGGKDGEVPIVLHARGQSGQHESGLTVYLRVDDPEDPAPYMNLTTNKLSHKDDNAGPVPALVGTALSPVPDRFGVYQATSGNDGEIDFTLKLAPGTAAGDNYQIEASFDPTFPVGLGSRSGAMTAWKRIFVEKHRMLRNGMPITQVADAGGTSIQVLVNHYQGNQGSHRVIKKGDHIVLVHSPALNRSDLASGWYLEYHEVADVQAVKGTGEYTVMFGTRQGKNIQPESLQHSFGPEKLDQAVGDAIAVLAAQSLTAADTLDAPDTLLAQYDASGNAMSAFPQAFVEYKVLAENSLASGSVPLPWVLPKTSVVMQDLANRWSSSVDGAGHAQPNHQLLLIGDTDSQGLPPDLAGETDGAVPGQAASIIYRGGVDFDVTQKGTVHSGQNPDNWTAKVEVHELTHQFNVDRMWAGMKGSDGFHCPSGTSTFDSVAGSPTLCVDVEISPESEMQVDNMIARYHLVQLNGVWNSEYFELRQRADPFVP